ncbi:TPA: Hsp20/alpha crystallin family protein [Candidatus Poribacteria bacterium]|nr:Hsp20/alpha crystallin family protein [Candidatus Poribacteria bacterium]
MSIMKWRPSRELAAIRDEMDRLFDEFFNFVPARRRELLEGEWLPNIDVAETDDNVIVTAELPGVKQDDVSISVLNDVLTLKGEKKEEKEIKRENYHRIERSYGSFQRSVSLPTGVQADKAKATYKDGVLTVTIPKAESAKPKSIKINIE